MRNRILLAAGVLPVVLMSIAVTALYATTGKGRPLCLTNGNRPSEDMLLRKGIWSHLQARPAIISAMESVETSQLGYGVSTLSRNDPTTMVSEAEIDEFLANNPQCCEIEAVGSEYGKINKIFAIATHPSEVLIRVTDASLQNSNGRPHDVSIYTVNACRVSEE
jgi:hypothetical protein